MNALQNAYATLVKIAANKLAHFSLRRALARDPLAARIGMFHAVMENGIPLPDEYALHIDELVRIVEAHRKQGFTFVSLETLLAQKSAVAARGMSVLTFDDGYAGVCTLAAPYLFAQDIPFTAYLTTDKLGRDGYLSSAQVRALSENPLCTIGSHLVTHPMTRFLSAAAVRAELVNSKIALEALLHAPVKHLAFPFGSGYAVSARDVRLARHAGYQSAALTLPAAFDPRRLNANYTLPRLHMLETGM